MPRPSPANRRAFVRRNTRLQPVPDLPDVRLHLADDVAVTSGLAAAELGEPDGGLPFWAFAWAGGLGIARYLAEHPDEVAGRRVVDVASGSGLCGVVAARMGASDVRAIDVDPLSEAAVALNARVNGVRLGFSLGDPLAAPPPPCDVLLAGDVFYEQTMAARMIEWLTLAAARGTRVLLGDPGRTYLPPGLEHLATYRVQTTRELESEAIKETSVFTIHQTAGRADGARACPGRRDAATDRTPGSTVTAPLERD
jgi:predicted nicotinamide N-methyase